MLGVVVFVKGREVRGRAGWRRSSDVGGLLWGRGALVIGLAVVKEAAPVRVRLSAELLEYGDECLACAGVESSDQSADGVFGAFVESLDDAVSGAAV